MHERRLHPRASVRIEASLRRGRSGAWERALVQDLSATGAGVRTAAPIELQTEVSLRFRLESGEGRDPIDVEAASLVVRTGADAGTAGLAAFAGLHFLGLEPEVFDAVRVWVWERLHPDG